MILTLATHATAAVAGYEVGVHGVPAVVAWLKALSTKRALKAAQAVITKAEADAKALTDAKALLASAPAPTPPAV